jgi:hypothetical protein
MRNYLFVAGIAAATLLPSFAFAQTSCERQHDNRVATTVGGGVLGALIGSAVAGHGDKTTGAVIGGVGGAVIGNQVGKPSADCAHAYGYYDSNGAWHANAVARTDAQGYYDRSGRWIEGAPNGAYDSRGRWVASSANGYYDRRGGWAPASVTGYYDTRGQWVAGAPSAYSQGRNASYDSRSNWAGAPTDVRSRAAWLDQRIRRGLDDGSLTRGQGKRALRSLNDIRREEAGLRHNNGQLNQRDEVRMQARLDTLSNSVRWSRQDNARND